MDAQEFSKLVREHIDKVGCPMCGGSGYADIKYGDVIRREPCPNECAPPVIFGRKV